MATHVGDIPIIFGDHRQPKALPLSHPKARYPGFKQETIVLKKGYRRRRGCLALPCDIVYERDTPVLLRDGTRVYVDIYRPVEGVVPAIVAWSPYGKYGGKGNQVLDDFPFRMGVPLWKLSELQKWEGPDPAYWCARGYAVVNPDPRGVGKSEGNIYQFGSQEGRDGADVVDWTGEQPWCTGKVATSGNSWLSIASWFIAAERPKHLAAIAPWEGLTDIASEGARGGVQSKPAMNFSLQLCQVNAGEGSWENPIAMLKHYKTANAYSIDKAARVEDIEVPAYVVASWTNPIHTFGTFRGYCRLKSDKWLRVHDSWEWPDYYNDAHQADLLRFFDHFLKGIDNGWETTPRVRMKILDTANPLPLTGSNLVTTAYPPPQATPRRLYLDGRTLSETPPKPSALHYKASTVGIQLDYRFARDTTLCGPLPIHLKLSLTEADSDIFVTVQKILKTGEVGSQLKIPYEKSWQSFAIRTANRLGVVPEVGFLFYQGPNGQIRVSRRAVDDKVPGMLVSDYSKFQPVERGQKVDIDVPMTPIGMAFAAGEALRLTIQGKDPSIFPPVDQGTLTVDDIEDLNKDVSVTIYSEGSYIDLPVLQST